MLCGFYLNDFRQLEERSHWLNYDRDFIAASGGAYATLLELRDLATSSWRAKCSSDGGVWEPGCMTPASRSAARSI